MNGKCKQTMEIIIQRIDNSVLWSLNVIVRPHMEFKNKKVVQNLELQLSELEMLNSMFPNDGELELADPGVISDIQDFLQGKLDRRELSKLQYSINLNTQGVLNISSCRNWKDIW